MRGLQLQSFGSFGCRVHRTALASVFREGDLPQRGGIMV